MAGESRVGRNPPSPAKSTQRGTAPEAKVFWFFFSKKNILVS
jgi:hypothetical protein